MTIATTARPLGWLGIVRLGLVQSAIGAMVMLATSLLNRVMVVEYGMAAAIPAGLVAWHYAVQLSRPVWGHESDRGRRRTPWIIGGMGVLALGVLLAVDVLSWLATGSWSALLLSIVAFSMIGAGVGAAGTSLLALLATRVSPARRPAAAAITWIMMVAGIVASAGAAGALIDPFSLPRLAMVVAGVALVAFLTALLAVAGIEGQAQRAEDAPETELQSPAFADALRAMLADRDARRFTLFVFVSMLAYSMQDMILEPFAGLVFGYSPGQSTQLAGLQHSGVLAGMIAVGVGASAFGGRSAEALRHWIVGGCAASALALAALAVGATVGPGWPLGANVVLLGAANGVFAVAAIGSMMALAGADGDHRAGVRMGVWGAAQAIAFGLGGLAGAVAVDWGRMFIGSDGAAFRLVFAGEGGLFLIAAALAIGVAPAVRRLALDRAGMVG